MNSIRVKSFGPIAEADITFGDCTLFVGPQASGKSLLLQLTKLLSDMDGIARSLRSNNYQWNEESSTDQNFLELYFGEGLGDFSLKKEIEVDGVLVSDRILTFISPRLGTKESYFYIPAQRILAMSEGWPRAFSSFDASESYVLKQFSQTIRNQAEQSLSIRNLAAHGLSDNARLNATFGISKGVLQLIDSSIFRGATISFDSKGPKRRIMLSNLGNSSAQIPFINWSAGQKEFMPLLLSLYYLMPENHPGTREGIETIIVEEPEMGLHPEAIKSLMVIFLELMVRGYKLIISTHSPVLLELMWTMRYIAEKGDEKDLLELFDLPETSSMAYTFKSIIEQRKTFKAFYFNVHDSKSERTIVKDISTLDARSEDNDIANWGGLTDFISTASDIVSRLAAR